MAYDFEAIKRKYGIGQTQLGDSDARYRSFSQAKPKQPSGAINFAGNTGKSAFAIGKGIVGRLAKDLVSGFTGLYSQARTNLDINKQQDVIDQRLAERGVRLKEITTAYKNRQLTKDQYKAAVAGLSEEYKGEAAKAAQLADQYAGYGEVGKNVLKAGGAVATLVAPALKAAQGAVTASRIVKGAEAAVGVGRGNLATKAVLNTLGTQPTVEQPFEVAKKLKAGDVKGAAGEAALLAAPVGIAALNKLVRKAGPALKTALVGKQGVLNVALGDQVAQYVKDNPKELTRLKRMELFTTNQPAVKAGYPAGDFLADHLRSIGVNPAKATIKEVLDNFDEYAKNVDVLEAAKKTGKLPENAVVSKDFREAIPAVQKRLEGAKALSLEEQYSLAIKTLDELGITNPTIKTMLGDAIMNGDDLASIVQKNVIPVKGLGKGFIATYGPRDRAALPSLAESTGELALGKKPLPVFGAAGTGLRKAGLGIEDADPKAYGIVKDNFEKIVKRDGLAPDGRILFDGLKETADSKNLIDARQLRVGEIADALNVERAQAKQIRKALDSAFADTPLAIRGASGKIQDLNVKYNPIARGYARIQSAARYTKNPFFKAQQMIEPIVLGQSFAPGKVGKDELKAALSAMRAGEFLPKRGKGALVVGEIEEALNNVAGLPKISGKLLKGEEYALANTLALMARRSGQSVEELMTDEKTRELLKTLVQYPSKGIASSNLAKAMNLAVFPLRYNAKVTALAAKALSNQPVAVQFGVVKGLADFKEFLDSDEGIRWQSDHSELIGLIKYFTPINSVASIIKALPGGEGSIRDLGAIGGLPFGVIARALEGQGAIEPQTPYLDPKTGEIKPDKLPISAGGQVKQLLRDVIETMYTFPGRQAGLPSKREATDLITAGTLKPAEGEFREEKYEDKLTDKQKQVQRVLREYRGNKGTITPSLDGIKPAQLAPIKRVPVSPAPPKSRSTTARKKNLAKRPGQPLR